MGTRHIVIHLFLFCFFFGSAMPSGFARTDRKSITAVRVTTPPAIDGTLSDPVWQKAPIASGFHQYEPHNDRPASFDTQVRVLYDDYAIYIGAKMLDNNPEGILREMGLRNSGNNINADRFYVDINPFNDGINGFRFQVSASGVQTDSNMSGSSRGGDTNWDAVWLSEVSITETGWIVEMRIPYSALRFPRGDLQEWGINFWREIRRTRETSSWNFTDRQVGDVLAYKGHLSGINGVSPPVRLALYPYLSNYMEKNGYDRGWANSINGGMDLKYGISPSFTMDMTLIPDFGQVQSDAKVLNLTPYEVKYDENRQFFTEGTELFGKADLFYSRRIGSRPRGYNAAQQHRQENELIWENPIETRLINATKLSGRTSGGLGIGVFNAMTAASKAVLKDTLEGSKREVTTQPFTNYNLVVLDQSFRNNSYLSLVNTNVSGSADGYMANVTGSEFRFLDASNLFRISGTAALSQQYFTEAENIYGHKYDIRFGKFGGIWQYNYSRDVISDTYDQNDMGFLRRNNRMNDGVSLSYNIFEPFWRFLSLSNTLSMTYSRLYEPRTFTSLNLQHNMRMLFDTRFHITLRTTYRPMGERDYYEPRVAGRFYRTDESVSTHLTYSSDYRRRVFVDGSLNFGRLQSAETQSEYGFKFQPTFRANDRLNLSYGIEYNEVKNDIGYVSRVQSDSIFFGRRQSPTVINTYRTTYIFNNHLSLNFNLRHYWSRVNYDGQYYLLQEDGRLAPMAHDMNIPNINYNAFTIDMLLTWHFAPGSQMTLAWKNVIDSRVDHIHKGYIENLRDILRDHQINSLSIRILYYLDYNTLRNLNRG